jgi:hypothetical protein
MRLRKAPALTMAWLLLVACPAQALAQAAWEYSPYEAIVWLALEPVPQLPSSLVSALGDSIASRTLAMWDGVLHVQVDAPPPALQSILVNDLDTVTADAIAAAASREALDTDKLYLTAITYRAGTIVVRMRELDGRTRQLGPVVERTCATTDALALELSDALTECFTPLARIEQVDSQTIVARLRAAGLIGNPASPALIEPGMVLRPVIRRNDRTGLPAKGGIQPIPWSFLTVEKRQSALLECTLRSGYRAAIPARGGARIERMALLVRPQQKATTLFLRSRSDAEKPLVAYEVHRRLKDGEKTELVGITDNRGSLVVPPGDGSLETLVVKNGRQLLARLPLVPGYEETLTARIVDDEGRLAAEGFVEALSSRVLDLVARREILAARIRSRIKEGKTREAQQLLDEFRRLETRTDLNRELDRFRQQVATNDKQTQQRIDRVFADAQKLLLLKPLSDELLTQLTREVTGAKAGGQ